MTYHHLSREERYQISALLKEGLTQSQIALNLGHHKSMISRSIARNRGFHPKPIMEDYLSRRPMGRPGKPEKIVAAVAFLASDDAYYITGHCLVVDGGLTGATGQTNFKRLFPGRLASV